ncbi:hypothetical protein CR513_23191, partial [Mucuna pruriens]
MHGQYDRLSKKLKYFRSGNVLEFNLVDFYKSRGIIHKTSCIETPQQNRIEPSFYRLVFLIVSGIMLLSMLYIS